MYDTKTIFYLIYRYDEMAQYCYLLYFYDFLYLCKGVMDMYLFKWLAIIIVCLVFPFYAWGEIIDQDAVI